MRSEPKKNIALCITHAIIEAIQTRCMAAINPFTPESKLIELKNVRKEGTVFAIIMKNPLIKLRTMEIPMYATTDIKMRCLFAKWPIDIEKYK
jgi:hypothetical protein